MGKNMRAALAFAKKYPGWHTFSRDRATRDAIERLAIRGVVVINQYGQFSIK